MPWHLVLRNLLAHPLRTLLTAGSLVIAVWLICTLRSIVIGLSAGVEGAASNRLMVQSAVSLFVDLPLSYQGKIQGVRGVAQTCKFQWFGGYFQDPGNFFAQFGVDQTTYFESYPEVELLEGKPEDFERTRTGCLIGQDLARRYGWKVGTRVPITGTIFQRADGGAWEFDVVGIYRSKASNVDNATLFFHYDFLRESIETGAAEGPPGVGVYVVKLAPGADVVTVSRAIDELFLNGPQRVQTTTEAEFQRQFVSMLGGVSTFLGSIGGGVLFAILLAVLNTMLLAGRERTRDIGIMKALGFSDGVAFALLMTESLVLCGLGGLAGIGLALATEPGMKRGMATIMPTYEVSPETIAIAGALALALGVIAGIGPALRVMNLRVVAAMRPEA